MFTENQSRQFYVATSTGSDVIAPVQVDSSHSATDLSAKSDGACQLVINSTGDEMYINYLGPKDGLQRTDRIKKGCITSVNCTAAADMKHYAKKAIITVDSALLSTSNLTITDDYILNVEIRGYITGGTDSTKVKFGATRGVSGGSASDLYKNLALSLAKNFARETVPLVDIYLCKTDTTSSTSTSAKFIKVTGNTAASSLTDTYLGICIEEVEQPWRLGAAPTEYVDFYVQPSTVYSATTGDVVWGKVQFYGSAKYTDGTASASSVGAPFTFTNSKPTADMEWFFHKERGDKYAEAGFPYNIDTKYMVNPDYTYGYSYLDIHYFTEGNSMNVGKSEKTITVVFPAASGSAPEASLQKFIGAAASGDDSNTGLYAFLAGTGVEPKFSAHYDATA